MFSYKLIVAWILILIAVPSYIGAQNIALGKTYTLSAAPNYAYSAPATDKNSLTDGIYTKGYFWTKPTTVGWLRRQVTITIDLAEVQTIGALTFNTARGTKVGVNFPQHVFVFVSVDNKNFRYAGDVTDSPDNQPGDYEVKKFTLDNINTKGRYLALVVVPNGKLAFCDEIEVLRGEKSSSLPTAQIPKDEINKSVDSLMNLEYNKNSLRNTLKSLGNNGRQTIHDSILSDKNVSGSDLKNIKNNLQQEHASAIRNRFKTSFIVEKYNPWDSLSEFHNPQEKLDTQNYQYNIPVGQVQWGSFIITNSSATVKAFSLSITSNDTSLSSIQLYNVPYVPGGKFSYVPDPLLVVDSKINIEAGTTQMFLFKVTGKKSGFANSQVKIASGDKTGYLNIRSNVIDLFRGKLPDYINANIWAYLTYPMLKDRQDEAARDLELHHVNTIVVPPAIAPKIKTNNYTSLLHYLSHFNNLDKILIFTNYSGGQNTNASIAGQFMSKEWKDNFITWYNNLVKTIHSNGFPDSKIYIYPYDEVKGKDVNDFQALVQWAKTAIPGIQFFATLSGKEAVNTILPLIDIAQIQRNLDVVLANTDLFSELPSHHAEIWLYSGGSPARSLSPYRFYRLMAWKAFANDITGVGFWAYADEGKNKELNLISDALTDPASSYSVIYDGPGKEIISSRRWEAFSLGIEDYSILNLYAEKFGKEKAKSLVQQVLKDDNNVDHADNVRNEMLKQLGF